MHPFSIESITSPPRPTTSANYGDDRVYATDDTGRSVPGSVTRSAHTCTTPHDTNTSPDSGISSPPVGQLRATDVAPRDESARGSPVTTPSSEKPTHSYIALISLAILGSPERRLVLSDIYQYVMTHFPYYDNEDRAWRNRFVTLPLTGY